MGIKVQNSVLPKLFNFVCIRAGHQPQVLQERRKVKAFPTAPVNYGWQLKRIFCPIKMTLVYEQDIIAPSSWKRLSLK